MIDDDGTSRQEIRMSDALNYLVKVRPEAMGAYFHFLKKAGDHLDTRTRDLISVITKVAVQTEPGFRQYLTRALRNGATPQEVIDALLMAFPVLGLAKIVWATEILLAMDMPEFLPENLDAEPGWHDLAAVDHLADGEVSFAEAAGRQLFIFRKGDDMKVYDSRCPHQVTNIPHLALEGRRLTCPKHNWAFDIESGECVEKGNRPLRQFEHKIEGGRLLAFW
jgi:nitrite reductase/ring-hydroxylating ferredoxin subunit/alkylhydroperoxidase/carboxymuconolactone decarboxylase family protein YurZ